MKTCTFWLAAFLVVLGCSSQEGSEPRPVATSGSEAVTDSPGVSTDRASAQTEPVGVAVEHGGSYWGVYVVVATPGAPGLATASEELRARGVVTSGGELGCDQGAEAALNAQPGSHSVAVYFTTQAEAEQFAASLPSPPVGIAEVTTLCAD
jgi:hypothetical protein